MRKTAVAGLAFVLAAGITCSPSVRPGPKGNLLLAGDVYDPATGRVGGGAEGS